MKPLTVVIALAGLPASGKSTFVTTLCQFLEECHERRSQLLLWNYDKVLAELMRSSPGESNQTLDANYQSFSPQQWTAGRRQILKEVEAALALQQWRTNDIIGSSELREFGAGSQLVRCVILDDNMYLQSMRKMARRAARRAEAHYLTIFFDVPLSVALERNQSRPLQVNKRILERMAEHLEAPQGWELPCSVTVKEGGADSKLALTRIRSWFMDSSPPKRLVSDQHEAETQAEGHKQELRLRKLVASTLQRAKVSLAGPQLRQLAAELAKLKKASADSGQFEEFPVQADLLLLSFLSSPEH